MKFHRKQKTDQPKAQIKQQRATALKKIPYSSFYTRQIVTRYRTLNQIMNKVRNKQNTRMHLERFRVVQSNPTKQPHLPIAQRAQNLISNSLCVNGENVNLHFIKIRK